MRRSIRYAFAAALLCAVIVVLIPIGMRLSVESYIYISVDTVPQAEVAIVPGASVENGMPSQVLAARADTAIALFQAGKVSKILVSGDNGQTNYNEVNPVQKYLLAAGIPAQDIFLDHAGFDTYSTMYRAIAIFGASSAIIVTQDFHMPRALYIARHLGLTAYGVDAEGSQGNVYDYIREIPASAKALFDIIVHRTPKFLGPSIPLTGDGATTWY